MITVSAEDLWRGATSVSNAGKKRGRGKGTDRKIKLNLNKGQKIGFGKTNMIWPGLTSPVVQANTLIEIKKLPPSSEPVTEEAVTKRKRFFKIHPLERGWHGTNIKGRSLGSPELNDLGERYRNEYYFTRH